jgi:hypothetical protein
MINPSSIPLKISKTYFLGLSLMFLAHST